MKAAIYARYSSDMQTQNSIDGQHANCLRYAEREGWDISERYDDKAISGSVKDRPAYQRMIADAQAGKFDVLLVDDLSRLSRDDIETKTTIRKFKFWGLRIVGVSDGFDSDAKGHKIQAGMRGMINEIYLDDLAEKTHRGLAVKARDGHTCGGRAYGYTHKAILDPSRKDEFGRPVVVAVNREPDPEQSKWVEQIFRWYADGYSPKWIAGELNRLGVPSPGSRWKRSERRKSKWVSSAIYGDMTKGTGILNNQLYIGEQIWNRSEWKKDPVTGKKKRFERPESEWIVTPVPELRIIDDDLWHRVKARQAETRKRSQAIQQALHKNARHSPRPKYLFSGILKCGECGASFSMRNQTKYGCGSHANGSKHACSNALYVRRDLVEQRLLEGIKQDLFTPEAIALFKKETTRLLAEARRQREPEAERLKRELSDAQTVADNIMAAIKAGIITDGTKAELEKAEAEVKRLTAEIEADAGAQDKVADFLPNAVERYQKLVSNLEKISQRDVPRAREQIKKLLGGEIKLYPSESGDYLEAEMTGDVVSLLHAGSGKPGVNWFGSGGRI